MIGITYLNRHRYLLSGRRLQCMGNNFLNDCLAGVEIKAVDRRLTACDVELYSWITEELLLRNKLPSDH